MNLHCHRLVFSTRLGQPVAVAETARGHGRGTTRGRRPGAVRVDLAPLPAVLALALAAAFAAPGPAAAQTASAARPPVSFASRLAAPANPLPQPYGSTRRADGSFVNDPTLRGFVADPALAGRVRWTVDGTTATFRQGDVDRIVLNWDSFDIGAGHSVKFEQNPDPQRAVSALNRIWSADPSRILGALSANREIILVNTNGVYFGAGARVDTGRFVASALGVADAVFERGLRSITDGTPVFSAAGTDHLPTALSDADGQRSAAVSVEAGAVLRSAVGGDVLLVAPRVLNQGRIETPGGQAVLAAGDKVYLMSSADPAQRGLIVAVDPVRLADGQIDRSLGQVENRSAAGDAVAGAMVDRLNEIRAERGSVNLVGLTVRQSGAVNATTAVRGANGSISLQAMDGTQALAGGTQATAPASRRGLAVQAGALARVASGGGTVELGAGSSTAVLPEVSAATQVDAEVFHPSRIRIEAEQISLASAAQLRAPGGQIDLLAASTRATSPLFDNALLTQPAQADASRIVLAPDAVLDAAGLRDVAIDGARNQGAQRLFRIELADAPVQRSGPLYRSELLFDLREAARIQVADLAGAAAAVGRTAQERASSGGSIRLQTEGALVVGEGARLDVSGGSLAVGATTLQTSLGLRGERTFQIAAAAAGNRIDSLAALPRSVAVPADTEGTDAGTLRLGARQLALAGTLAGGVVQGAAQRDGSQAAARAGTLQVGRETGIDFDLPALTVVAGPVTGAALGLDAGFLADPLAAALPAVDGGALLSARHLGGAAGFGTLRLRAGDVAVGGGGAAPLALDLGSGGVLDLRASRITLDTALRAAGGQVSLATTLTGLAPDTPGLGDIRLSGGTRLDVAGLWTNLNQDGASTRPAQDAGGSITVNAGHALVAQPGAVFDVSGGATLTTAGALRSGLAGSLSLRAGRSIEQPGWLQLDGVTLRGVDFASGGTLTLGSQALQIGGDAAASDASHFRPDPAWFTRSGFGRIELLAFGDVTVASGTTLAPSLLNWALQPAARLAAGDRMDAVATPLAIDPTLASRAPVSLSLAAEAPLNPGLQQAGGSVVVARGAGIMLEPGAALALRASRDITVGATGAGDGPSTLQAPGGRITLTLSGQRGAAAATSAGDDPAGDIAGQAIWLGADARLSVAGTAQLRAERLDGAVSGDAAGTGAERLVGRVLGGGQVSLVAQRGHVVAEAGSQINLDGAQALVHQAGLAAPVNVARAAGTLRISSPEGTVLDGSVSAQPPRDAQGRALADGGRLQVDLGTGGINGFTAGTPYPVAADDRPAPRQVLIGDFASVLGASGLQPGDSLTGVLGNGTAYLPLRLLRDAGFDGLRLGAGDRIRFDADLNLSMPLGITLDTPVLAAGRPGVQVALGGSQLTLGDQSINRLGLAPDRSARPADVDSNASLSLRAPTISLVGRSALQGFASSLLAAGDAPGGEIRGAALDPGRNDGSGNGSGGLAFAGDLQLDATRLWASSGSVFDITGLAATGPADPGSRLLLRTGAAGAASAVPLSAFGSLNLAATRIDHDGVLMQPFGAITLAAGRDLRLGPHSLTSVAGPDPRLGLLYGETQNLSQWLLPNGLFATTLPVAKGITLQAQQVHTDAAARIDARGGGDVRAWEFFAGVGGSQDALAATDAWAVLPQQPQGAALALDGKLAAEARQLVVTQAGSALAPGAYTLLPARHALQGEVIAKDPLDPRREVVVNSAVLVRLAADQTGAATAGPLVQDDGSAVVGGYLRAAGSVHADATPARWVIEPAATWQARSDQRVTSVGGLLGGRASGTALPQDAGRVTLQLGGAGSTPWSARLALAGQGGRGGELDVVATRLVLADDSAAAAAADAGALVLQAQVLRDSAAGSVLLGGRRSSLADAADGAGRVAVDASANQALRIALDPARPLVLDELVLASAGTLDIAAGSRLQATAADGAALAPRSLQLTGDGALAAVSAQALQVQRGNAGLAAGTLSLGAGAVLAGRSVALDATAALQLDTSALLQAASLDLAARRLVIGDGSGDLADATLLAGPLLATARQAAALTLRGYASIDVAGRQDWAGRGGDAAAAPATLATALVLDTPLLRGLPGADGTPAQVDLAARSVLLRNTSGRTADAATQAAGSGTLALQALPPLQHGHTGGLSIGPGLLGLGFGEVMLRSGGDIVLAGSGGVAAQGDLALRAARLTAATGADQVLRAAGTLGLAAEPGARSLGEIAGLGAQVALVADQVLQDGRIDLPAGQLRISAAGTAPAAGEPALRFGAGSVTSVAGAALLGDLGQPAWVQPGTLQATAGQGRIDLLGTLDASAAASAAAAVDGGAIRLQASGAGGSLVVDAAARLRGAASRSSGADAPLGGRLAVDASTLAAGSLDSLAAAAGEGGLTQAFSLRQRQGDLVLDSRLQAQRISLAADAGALTLGRHAELVADAPGGGVVALAAGQDLRLADGARIGARGTRQAADGGPGSNGGDVLLASSGGRIGLAAGAHIDATGDGADDGRIVLRALRGADNASVQVDRFDAAQLRAGEVDIEAVQVFSQLGSAARPVAISRIAAGTSTTTGGVGTLGQTSLRDDSAAFMRHAPAVLAGLGLDGSAVHLRAGVEVRATGDLSLASNWALNDDRPGGDAGFLTLRAAGNLNLNASLSDGFASALATAALGDHPRGWSLRLAAGADLGAALPTAVLPAAADADLAPASGNLSIAAGRLVRTGAGSIDLAAAGDIRFGAGSASTAPGQVYIAGRKADELPGLLQGLFNQQAAKPTFTTQGGRLTVEAGRDIQAGESTQLVNNWLWRSGLASNSAAEAGQYSAVNHLAWWTEFSRFRQTLGSFGGGELLVDAGRDIVNLQALLPDAGWADSREMADASVRTLGGADLQVQAGRDVRGGQFLVAGGTGRIDAGGAVAAAAGNAQIDALLLSQMDGSRWQVQARQDLALAGSFNPTAAPPSAADSRGNVSGFFYGWGEGAALSLRSAAGEVNLAGGIGASQIGALGLVGGATAPGFFRVLPASLDITAASGALRLLPDENTGAVLFPSASGLLTAWAGADLALGSSSNTPNLALADSDPGAWPSARAPMARTSGLITGTDGLVATTLAGTADNTALRRGDARPVTLHAGGTLRMDGDATLLLPKASLVSAGGDILNLRISGQNLQADDLSELRAGGSILAGQLGELRWGGPGVLALAAGRDIDLGNAAGISTIGNQRNARLPAQGASVRLTAATAGTLDLAVLDAAYLGEGASLLWQQHRDTLRDFVRSALVAPTLDFAQARTLFAGFPAAAQQRLAQQLLAAEFGARYLDTPAPTASAVAAGLRAAWPQRLADIVAGADDALAAGDDAAVLVLPGRELLRGGAAIRNYVAALRSLDVDRVDTDAAARTRSLQLASVQIGWRAALAHSLDSTPAALDTLRATNPQDPLAQAWQAGLAQPASRLVGWRNLVAQSLGSTAEALDGLLAANPQDPQALAWQAGLAQRSGRLFDDYRRQVLAAEIQGAGDAAAGYGRATLPLRLALFDQAVAATELAGLGSFVAQPIWQGQAPLLAFDGALNLTQSAVVTERGGDIALLNPGGAVNVGLKQSDSANAKGVIALGGGDILGLARNDFQVNTQRVFIVGSGDMTLWSTAGDIDSGRGANTAVAAPPLAARRTADGVVFEVPATTTGSGLGILPDVAGRSSGTIGLYPAFGEILALDALIRAPRVVAASSVRGGDNLVQTGGGSAAPVAPPPPAVTPPPTQAAAAARTEAATAEATQRQRNSLLTVDLLGLGEAPADAPTTTDCSDADLQAGKCRRPARPGAAAPAAPAAPTTPPTRSP